MSSDSLSTPDFATISPDEQYCLDEVLAILRKERGTRGDHNALLRITDRNRRRSTPLAQRLTENIRNQTRSHEPVIYNAIVECLQ